MDKKYIYATWDRYYGTDATKEYIYRIAKDGKSAKKLAIGRDPQLVDGRIYYLALKSKSEDGMNYSEDTGTVMSICPIMENSVSPATATADIFIPTRIFASQICSMPQGSDHIV